MPLGLDEQLACVRREVALRMRCYPAWVQRGSMTQAWADYQLAAMQAVLTTLEGLADAQTGQRTLFSEEA